MTIDIITEIELFKCHDCGIYVQRFFENHDKKKRCEKCATLEYRNNTDYMRMNFVLNEAFKIHTTTA